MESELVYRDDSPSPVGVRVRVSPDANAREERWRPYHLGRRPKAGDTVRIAKTGRRGEVHAIDEDGDPIAQFDGWPRHAVAVHGSKLEWLEEEPEPVLDVPPPQKTLDWAADVLKRFSAAELAMLSTMGTLQRFEPEVLLDHGHMRLERLADGALRFRDNRSENPDQWSFVVHLTPSRLRFAALGAFAAEMPPENVGAVWGMTDAEIFPAVTS